MAGRPVVALVGAFDEANVSVEDYLERRGLEIRAAHSGWQAESLLAEPDLDVAVVDLDIEHGSGLALLKQFARQGGPFFVIVSDRPDMVEKVLALELGAADVVEKSVSVRELAARVLRLVARRGKAASELVVLENTTVDLKAALVMHRSGIEEGLSPGQVALFRLFLANPGRVLTRDDIIAAAPAESADAFDRSIDSRIVRLRRKLDTERIVTIRGSGYRFDPPTGAH
ncbi:response regulator transcription factor [Mesorhizobium sp. BAC0120]|uniref:response regulator transcription factor n=1 Tax=Mesorhizobium sp. BAC0120 TaxID=3090670 RepID=UPI00298D17AE|nr:response regulator transcription factor [Mesorhizobium sp. BAC0120]MDW6021513.1 response regulator transcription factor [Mesorhizobium sp. BAC0120]